MVKNARISELIREERADEIPDAIADGAFLDMQSFSQALIELVLAGEVEREVAASAASNRHDFLLALNQAVLRKEAGVDDVLAAEAQKRPQEPEPETNLRVVEW